MEKFCDCNSNWIDTDFVGVERQIQLNFTPEYYHMDYRSALCSRCQYWFWYDADYENMMFDLKNMNQQ